MIYKLIIRFLQNNPKQPFYKRYVLPISFLIFSSMITIWFFVKRWKLLIVRETELPVATALLPPHRKSNPNNSSEQSVQAIQSGRGHLYNRTYQVDILHPTLDKEMLLQRIIEDINGFAPQEMAHFEKTKGEKDRWQIGDEFVVQIVGPWNGPVCLVDLQPTSFSFVTLEGHIESGEIQFCVLDHPDQKDAVRFEIRSWARSSNRLTDFMYQKLGISKFSQTRMWAFFCDKVVEESGGERLGEINIMTHKAPYKPESSERVWKQYSTEFDRWSTAELNFDPSKREDFTEVNGWYIDKYVIGLPSEESGEPVPGGAWEAAKQIVSNYEFPDPSLVTGIFVPDNSLQERIMIVKARFLLFTFLFGVRVSQVVDEIRDTEQRGQARVWGYGYRTLKGHFEMGEIMFEVWKFLESGDVEFHIDAYSKPASISNPFYQLGFRIFGRSLQRRFGATSLERMQQLVIERTASTSTLEKPIETPEVQAIADDERATNKIREIKEAETELGKGIVNDRP